MLELSLFDPKYDGRQVPAGETIFRVGDPADCLYVVLDGAIEIDIAGHAPETMERGDVFGELALIDGGVRSGSARATADSVLVPLGRLRLEAIISKHPSFALDLLTLIVGRLRDDRARLTG